MLYHLLPVIFWLLAVGGSLIPFAFSIPQYALGYIPVALVMLCIFLLSRIERHSDSIEECFQVAILIGIASFWLPTVVFLLVPIWAYLIYYNVFSLQSVTATISGLGFVALWASLFIYLGWIDNPWMEFFAQKNAWGWIPTGAFLLAWLSSTIARQILRVR